MCGRVDVDGMLDEMTPEQMDLHIAAMRADPCGDARADYRTAYIAWVMFNLWSTSEGKDAPSAEDFLNELHYFIDKGTTKEEAVELSPEEAAKQLKGIV